MLKLWPFLVSATFVLAAPATALAARGEATTNVNMRAGPGTEYPAVSLIPADARIDIHGCLKDATGAGSMRAISITSAAATTCICPIT
jgi:uncharacterized protein YraI